MMAIVSLDSPSCEVPCLILHSVVYRDVTRQAKGLHRLKYVGVLERGLANLSGVIQVGSATESLDGWSRKKAYLLCNIRSIFFMQHKSFPSCQIRAHGTVHVAYFS
jgi:hypothetical protein